MTVAAAVIMRKEKDLVAQFRQARALTPETARPTRRPVHPRGESAGP